MLINRNSRRRRRRAAQRAVEDRGRRAVHRSFVRAPGKLCGRLQRDVGNKQIELRIAEADLARARVRFDRANDDSLSAWDGAVSAAKRLGVEIAVSFIPGGSLVRRLRQALRGSGVSIEQLGAAGQRVFQVDDAFRQVIADQNEADGRAVRLKAEVIALQDRFDRVGCKARL